MLFLLPPINGFICLWNILMQGLTEFFLKDSSKITTTNEQVADRLTDWIDDARCLPDGFPVEIYVDSGYWGLYALRT